MTRSRWKKIVTSFYRSLLFFWHDSENWAFLKTVSFQFQSINWALTLQWCNTLALTRAVSAQSFKISCSSGNGFWLVYEDLSIDFGRRNFRQDMACKLGCGLFLSPQLYFLGKSVCTHVLTQTNLFICRFLFGLSTFFSLHGHFMLFYREKLEPSDRACYGKFLRGHRSAWFPLFISACRFVESATFCHVLVHCFGPFLSQDMFLSLQVFICFWETKYDVYCERVAYLHSKLWRRARLWLQLLTST